MTLYAISHKATGSHSSVGELETIASKTHVASLIKRQPDIFNKYTFYEKESRAQAVLETYKEEYQKFYEVRPFIITPKT